MLGDRNRLEQVAANLVDNALKYSPADEPVDVHVEETDDEVVLKVIDRGPGIPAEEREQLFDRLFRGRGGTGSRLGGLGLGLYIVRDIVERHGGKVWVDSKVGEGSTFQVSLPLLETERQRAGSWMQPSPPA